MRRLARAILPLCSVFVLVLSMVVVTAISPAFATPPAPSPYPSSGPSCTKGGSADGQGLYSCTTFEDDPIYAPPISATAQPAGTVTGGDNSARFLNQCKLGVDFPFPNVGDQYHSNPWIAQTLVNPSSNTTKGNVGWTSEYAFVGANDWMSGQPALPITPGSKSDGTCSFQIGGLTVPVTSPAPAKPTLNCTSRVNPTDQSSVVTNAGTAALPSVFPNASGTSAPLTPGTGDSNVSIVTVGFNPNCNGHSVVWGNLQDPKDDGRMPIAQVFYTYGGNTIPFGQQYYGDLGRNRVFGTAQFFGFENTQYLTDLRIFDYEPPAPVNVSGVLKICTLAEGKDANGIFAAYSSGKCDEYAIPNSATPKSATLKDSLGFTDPDDSVQGTRHSMTGPASEATTDGGVTSAPPAPSAANPAEHVRG